MVVSKLKKLVLNLIVKILKRYHRVACNVLLAPNKERPSFVFGEEYIRTSSLELIANEIYEKGVSGDTAELGVYRGDFASCINLAFPDRKLYLFDTFEGFDKKDISVEHKNNYSDIENDLSKTSVELVLSKMKHKENCVVKKGYFPDSATELGGGGEEKQSLLSLV